MLLYRLFRIFLRYTRWLRGSYGDFLRRYHLYFRILFERFFSDLTTIGLGLGVLFFYPFVFLAVVDSILREHYLILPIDLALLWAIFILPLVFIIDCYLWLFDVAALLKRILLDDPRPLAGFIGLMIPVLGRFTWVYFELSFRLRVVHHRNCHRLSYS